MSIPEATISREGESPPRGVSEKLPITAAKEAVTVANLAELLSGPGERRGKRIFFRCPLHDDNDPSLGVDTEKNLWHCFPCGIGGDVVRLAQLAWNHEDTGRGAATAAAELLMTFGHELPERPPSWFRRQERQRPVRNALDRARFEHLRRRLFRRFFVPLLVVIEDEGEREEEAAILWDATDHLARMVNERRSR